MEEPPPSPPQDDMPPDDVQQPPQGPIFLADPNDNAAFEAALDQIVNRQLEERHEFLRQARGNPLMPEALLQPHPDNLEHVLSPQVSDEEEEEENHERELRVRQNIDNFLDAQQIRREARMVLREVRDRHNEARLEQEQQEPLGQDVEINNNGDFRNFNGILSPSPSPSPSASPIPMDEDLGADEDPSEQARPDDEDIDNLNEQMLDMQPHMSRPRKRHNSADSDAIKKKRVTFKMDSSDEAINSLDDDPPDFGLHDAAYRRGFDDDDEGFYGGPPARHNSFST